MDNMSIIHLHSDKKLLYMIVCQRLLHAQQVKDLHAPIW